MTAEMAIVIVFIGTILAGGLGLFIRIKFEDKLEYKLEEYFSRREEREKEDAIKHTFVDFVKRNAEMLKELNVERNFTKSEWAKWFLNDVIENKNFTKFTIDFNLAITKREVYEWVETHYPEVFQL